MKLIARMICRSFGHRYGRARDLRGSDPVSWPARLKECKRCHHVEPVRARKRKA